MEDYKQILGDNIRKQRAIRHLTQEALAHRANMETASIGRIERGQANPTLHNLIRVSEALDKELPVLLSVEEKDTMEIYLKGMDLNRLPDSKRRASLALLQLLYCLQEEELEEECEQEVINTILEAVQYTSYEVLAIASQDETGQPVVQYGIRATSYARDQSKRVAEIFNISTSREIVENLAHILNHRFVSITSFPDVVTDFIDNNYELR